MAKFPKYNLSAKQIRGLARIVDCEQGTTEGEYAEASLMANLIDCEGDAYATTDRLISFVTRKTDNWFAYGRKRFYEGYNDTEHVPAHAIKAVEDVIVKGKRTLPRHCVEHDCMSDIKSVKNGSKSKKKEWERGKTVITNTYGSEWIFWSFPGGYNDDPFGYKKKYREKWGDFCYTYEQASDDNYKTEKQGYQGIFPVVPDSSFGVNRTYYQKGDGITTLKRYGTQIFRTQSIVNWAIDSYEHEPDGKYGNNTVADVKKLQHKAGLPENGKFGKLCLDYVKSLKK